MQGERRLRESWPAEEQRIATKTYTFLWNAKEGPAESPVSVQIVKNGNRVGPVLNILKAQCHRLGTSRRAF